MKDRINPWIKPAKSLEAFITQQYLTKPEFMNLHTAESAQTKPALSLCWKSKPSFASYWKW